MQLPLFIVTELRHKFPNFIDNKDGTITDTKNRLTWMRAPFGMEFINGQFRGQAERILWEDAVKRFGRGTVYDAFKNSDNIKLDSLLKASRRSEGYTEGSEHVYFAGSSDWSLPTIVEFYTLEDLGKNSVNIDGYLWNYFFLLFFRGSRGVRDQSPRMVHSANARTDPPIFFRKLRYQLAWGYYLDSHRWIDFNVNAAEHWSAPVLLVRLER
ncbi:MAG: DUF1566 domain-containing protein [Bacteroidetes bacterium]|nr:DUF1566 domain-containing protein [Bacteroidota bacterium]